jgi:hypothetical protein
MGMRHPNIYRLIIVSTAGIFLCLLYFFYPAFHYDFYPPCIFHKLTGLYCPGCGSQRAASALLHGQWTRAFGYNFLMVLSLPWIGYSAFAYTWNVFSPKKMNQAIFHSPVFIWTALTLVLIFWIARNIPVLPFTVLAP